MSTCSRIVRVGRDYPPTTVHQFFARLPRLLRDKVVQPRFPIILTTAYDNLLEAAFDAAHEPYDLLRYTDWGKIEPGEG